MPSGVTAMTQEEKDLRTYYNALPDWAKQEMVDLVQAAAKGELNMDYYVLAFEDIMTRVDLAKTGRQAYLH
jgi:hypothetical protein